MQGVDEGRLRSAGMPAGVRDLLPRDTALRDELTRRLADALCAWGYRRVATPTFELAKTISVGLGPTRAEETYQFFDRSGRLLVLRPDFTTPLARLAAAKLRQEPLPLRLFYTGDLFRRAAGQEGRLHEVAQVGLELMGSKGAAADAEVMAVAADCLRAAGLAEFKLGIGHVGFLESALAEAGLTEGEKAEVRRRLMARDFVSLPEVLDGRQIPGLGNGRPWEVGIGTPAADVLEGLKQQVKSAAGQAAVAEMGTLLGVLAEHGLAEVAVIDLTLVRDFAYYTGPVFEFYVPHLGVPVCAGGRYDGLLGSFGYPVPATGFAIGLNELEAAVQRSGADLAPRPALDFLLVGSAADRRQALQEARRLRSEGYRVAVEWLEERPLAEMRAYARANGAQGLLLRRDGQWCQETVQEES